MSEDSPAPAPTPAPVYDTVAELMAHLATLDPEMPLTSWGNGGLFERGISPTVRRVRRLNAEPTTAVLETDTTFGDAELGKVQDALIF